MEIFTQRAGIGSSLLNLFKAKFWKYDSQRYGKSVFIFDLRILSATYFRDIFEA